MAITSSLDWSKVSRSLSLSPGKRKLSQSICSVSRNNEVSQPTTLGEWTLEWDSRGGVPLSTDYLISSESKYCGHSGYGAIHSLSTHIMLKDEITWPYPSFFLLWICRLFLGSESKSPSIPPAASVLFCVGLCTSVTLGSVPRVN